MNLRHDVVPHVALVVARGVLHQVRQVRAELVRVDALPDEDREVSHRCLLVDDVLRPYTSPVQEGTVSLSAGAGRDLLDELLPSPAGTRRHPQ